ncbi:hypothetical protein [Amycolatopsis lexingtonensis]|uniref:hypothetical protein n=1 Tax=Amycolatopsis lexingtonensis TaxID=218822 RepID=UPI003F722740
MGFAEQLDEMVERIIDEAIKFFMASRGWQLNMHGNYEQWPGGDGSEITPPGSPSRTSGGQVLRSGMPGYYDGFEYGVGRNAGSLVYGHFETTIRDLFRPWRTIPDPAAFDDYLDQVRDAAWSVSLTSAADRVSSVGNAALDTVGYLQEKIGGENMRGATIFAFDQNFCTPLPTVLHGQYAVALLAGVTLLGEKEIWAKAREDVHAIAEKMHAAMKNRGSAVADLGTITALFALAAAFPTPAQPILAGVGAALPALETLLNAGAEPNKQPVEFAGGTPEKVIASAGEALKTLARTIRGCEDDIKGKIKDGMETVTRRSGSFAMPKPKLLEVVDVSGIKVDLEVLHFLATDTLPQIEKQINDGADLVYWGSMCGAAWYRSSDLGVSDTTDGPFPAWQELAALAGNLMSDLAWEVKESAVHLQLAAERHGRTEAEITESLRRHARKLEGFVGHDPIGTATRWLDEHP